MTIVIFKALLCENCHFQSTTLWKLSFSKQYSVTMVIFKARMTIGMTSMHIYPFPSCVFQTNLFSECNLHSQSSKRSVAVCFRFGQKMFRLGFEWKGFHMKTCNGDDDEVLIRKCFLYKVVFSHIMMYQARQRCCGNTQPLAGRSSPSCSWSAFLISIPPRPWS